MPWGDLDADGYTGIELWSFVTDSAERVNSIRELLSFIAAPARFLDHPPRRNLDEWDRLCARRRCVALGGVDAHQVGIRIRGRVPLRLMAYKRSFRHLRTHLLVPEPLTRDVDADRAAVFGALRAGHAYIAVDSLAPAAGFRFWAEGDGVLEMGDEARGGSWTLRVQHAAAGAPAPAARRRRGCDRARRLPRAPGDAPGVYRVEAYRDAHGRERTWILSNPIYLRVVRDEDALRGEQRVARVGVGVAVDPAVVDLDAAICQIERRPSGTAPGISASTVVLEAHGEPSLGRQMRRRRWSSRAAPASAWRRRAPPGLGVLSACL